MRPIPPKMTDEQRAMAAQRSSELRIERAQIKADLKAGNVTLAQALEYEAAQRMLVRELIAALPNYGSTRAGAVMEHLRISPIRRVAGLGPKQKAALLERFAKQGSRR